MCTLATTTLNGRRQTNPLEIGIPMLDDDLQLPQYPPTRPPPMIEEGMPHALVVRLIGAPVTQRLERGAKWSLSNEIFHHSSGKYDLLFDKHKVVEVREQPINAERLPAKVVAALMATSNTAHTNSSVVQIESTVSASLLQILTPWLIVVTAVAICCFIPYVATALQIVAIILGAVPVIYLGLLFSPIGMIYLGIQFLSVLLGGHIDDDSPQPTIGQFLYSQFMLIASAIFFIVVAVVVCLAAEPVGGVLARLPKSSQSESINPGTNLEFANSDQPKFEQTQSAETEKQTAENVSKRSYASPVESTESTNTTNVPKLDASATNKDLTPSADNQSADIEQLQKEPNTNVSSDATAPSATSPLDPHTIVRTWQDNTGAFQIEAKCVSFDGESVTLLRTNGKQSTVKLSRLSKADLDWLHTNFPKDTPH